MPPLSKLLQPGSRATDSHTDRLVKARTTDENQADLKSILERVWAPRGAFGEMGVVLGKRCVTMFQMPEVAHSYVRSTMLGRTESLYRCATRLGYPEREAKHDPADTREEEKSYIYTDAPDGHDCIILVIDPQEGAYEAEDRSYREKRGSPAG